MKFTADLHLHTDYIPELDRCHGERPELLAHAIADSNLDAFAITEHNRVSSRYADVQEEVAKLLRPQSINGETRSAIHGLLGVELSVTFESHLYHVGYVFEGPYHRQNLPAVPEPYMDAEVLHQLKKSYPGVCILFHPTLHDDRKRPHADATRRFMRSGLFDGIEIINGTVLSRGTTMANGQKLSGGKRDPAGATRSAMAGFLEAKARYPRLAAIGNSDAHRAPLVGSAYTKFCASSPAGIFDAIRSGNTRAVAGSDGVKTTIRPLLHQAHGIGTHAIA